MRIDHSNPSSPDAWLRAIFVEPTPGDWLSPFRFVRPPQTDDMRQMLDDLERHGGITGRIERVFLGIDWGGEQSVAGIWDSYREEPIDLREFLIGWPP